MIRIGLQTGGIMNAYPNDMDSVYRVIAESGFDAVDANINRLFPADQVRSGQRCAALEGGDRDFLSLLTPWKAAADKYGLKNEQAHAPFPSMLPGGTPEISGYLIDVLQKFIMGCDHIGCRKLVIHPFMPAYDQQTSPEQEWALNIEGYSRLIPHAKQYGVMLLVENLVRRRSGVPYTSCTSDLSTACRLVDELNRIAGEKVFGFCLDIGHLLTLGLDVKNAMIQLGSRIEAFHIHDNNGLNDQHMAPYMGVLDWNRFVEGLAAIRYDQTLSFETFNVWNKVDHELCPTLMKLIAQTGRMFARRAEAIISQNFSKTY